MIRLKVGLMPKNSLPLISNYRNYPLELCNKLMNKSDLDFIKNLENPRPDAITDETQLFYCSNLFCSQYEKDGFFTRFKSKVSFNITSSFYEIILHFTQHFFAESKIKFGFAEFEVISLEISEVTENNVKESYSVLSSIPYNMNEIFSLIESRKIV
jgi:CRISPR/Cas system endoribonuclease Cas6 (RAMP superfamily)